MLKPFFEELGSDTILNDHNAKRRDPKHHTTIKNTIRNDKTPTNMFLSIRSTPSPLKSVATTLGTLVLSPIVVSRGRILVIEPLLRFFVTRIILRRPHTLFPYFPNIGLQNLLSIHHEPKCP